MEISFIREVINHAAQSNYSESTEFMSDTSVLNKKIRELTSGIVNDGESSEGEIDDLIGRVSTIKENASENTALLKMMNSLEDVLAFAKYDPIVESEVFDPEALKIPINRVKNPELRLEMIHHAIEKHGTKALRAFSEMLDRNDMSKIMHKMTDTRRSEIFDQKGSDGKTLFHWAVETKKEEITKGLLRSASPQQQQELLENADGVFAQHLLIDKLKTYVDIKSPGNKFDTKGLCYGLSLLYTSYQLMGRTERFFERVGEIIKAKPEVMNRETLNRPFKDLSSEAKSFEYLFSEVSFLHASVPGTLQNKPMEKLKFLRGEEQSIKDLKKESFFKFVDTFSIDPDTKTYKNLQETLAVLISQDADKEKVISLSTGDHAFVIHSKDNKFWYFDPNSYHPSIPVEISSDGDMTNINEAAGKLAKQITASLETQGRPLSLGIEVFSNQELNKTKSLKAESMIQNLRGEADFRGFTSLYLAVQHGFKKVTKALLKNKDLDVNTQSKDGLTALHVAVLTDQLDMMKPLIDRPGSDINLQDKDKKTALHHSVEDRKKEMVDVLLGSEKLKVNLKDKDGNTPLHSALKSGDQEIITKLLNKDELDVNTQNDLGLTALHLAASHRRTDTVRLLLSKNEINLQIKDIDGLTALHYAGIGGEGEEIEELIQQAIERQEDNSRVTRELLKAIDERDEDLATSLIKQGPIIFDLTDEGGWNAEDLAYDCGYNAIGDQLKELKEIGERTSKLFKALNDGNQDSANSILDQGVIDFEATDESEWNAEDLAYDCGYYAIGDRIKQMKKDLTT